MDADRDGRLVEAGGPPWGDVLPGTDTVEYYTVDPDIERDLLFRVVSMEGALCIESFVGSGRWKVDSRPFSYYGSAPGDEMKAIPIRGRESTKLMTAIDRKASGEQGEPVG